MKKNIYLVGEFLFLLCSFFLFFSPVKAQSILLDSVSSNAGYVNSAGQVGNSVWLRGSGFGSIQGSGSVSCLLHYADKLTGQLNRTTTLTWPVSSWSDTLIVATVPAFNYPGTCEVSVRNDSAEQSNTKVFSVFFTLYSITPNSVKEGETVTITGNFMGYGFGTNGGGWPNASVRFCKRPEYICSYFTPVSWIPTKIVARVVAPSGVSLPVTAPMTVAIPNGFSSYLEMATQDLTINPIPTPTPTPTSIPPTPTPTIEYSYCETGACKIRYTSAGLTACKGIVNGCFCTNVNCRFASDCVTQTGANSCNICDPGTLKCQFSPTSTPTPTPTCSLSDPSQPQLVSPPQGATLTVDSVNLTWQAVASWGEDCLPGSNNRYKAYFTSNAASVADGDLSNEGGNLVCNVNENTLYCTQSKLLP